MASIRFLYCWVSVMAWKRPIAWVDFMPSSCSSGTRKVSNASRISAVADRRMSFTCGSTSVENTMGCVRWRSATSLMRATASRALSGLSTKEIRCWRTLNRSNCASTLCPSVSAVIPVPSDTKNTSRSCNGGSSVRSVMDLRESSAREGRRIVRFWHTPVNTMSVGQYVIAFSRLRMNDVELVGGKNASLGEMLSQLSQQGIRIPDGFATTAEAFRDFLRANDLTERVAQRLEHLNVDDVAALKTAGQQIRSWVESGAFPAPFESQIYEYYQSLIETSSSEISVAVRSSATAEDLPGAS